MFKHLLGSYRLALLLEVRNPLRSKRQPKCPVDEKALQSALYQMGAAPRD